MLDLNGPMTLLVWARYMPTETWYPALLGKGYESTGAYGMHIRPGGTVWFEIDAPDGTRHVHHPTDLCLAPGQWSHVAATYDGAVMRVYLNGREAGSGKPVVTAVRPSPEPLRFGWLGSYGHFNGMVREVMVYTRAMTAGEVFARYEAGR
ncbi:MAG: LamG domain-containing protein [Pirellulales bacterium]|nr:LamG domain-containing protein [Pirellulales bacterium]